MSFAAQTHYALTVQMIKYGGRPRKQTLDLKRMCSALSLTHNSWHEACKAAEKLSFERNVSCVYITRVQECHEAIVTRGVTNR